MYRRMKERDYPPPALGQIVTPFPQRHKHSRLFFSLALFSAVMKTTFATPAGRFFSFFSLTLVPAVRPTV